MNVQWITVNDKKSHRLFCDVARMIYADDPNWVCPLDIELAQLFSPKHNTYYNHGEAIRWVLVNDNGELLGRIAAFINRNKALTFEQPTGGIGFFESVNNTAIAHQLFNKAKTWLAERGMEAMDGPINFGENDRYWGLLVANYSQPMVGTNYHPPYYKELFESFGFFPYFEQRTQVTTLDKIPERIHAIAERVVQRNNIQFRTAERNNLYQYGLDFMTIYNEAWQEHPNFTPLALAQVEQMVKELKFVLIPKMASFAYVDNEPAGFIIALPDLNQIIKPFRGRPSVWQLLQFLWRKRDDYRWYREKGILNQGRAIIIGVRPKYRKMGLESAMVTVPMRPVMEMGINRFEIGWVGDFNPIMRSVQEAFAVEDAMKIHLTYRYLFNEDAVARERQQPATISRN
jgi:hypothetical protein